MGGKDTDLSGESGQTCEILVIESKGFDVIARATSVRQF